MIDEVSCGWRPTSNSKTYFVHAKSAYYTYICKQNLYEMELSGGVEVLLPSTLSDIDFEID